MRVIIRSTLLRLALLLASSPLTVFAQQQPAIGDTAPAFSAGNSSGAEVNFDPAARTKPALILFWATWCPYCKALMPELQTVIDTVGADAADGFAIDIREDEDADPAAVLAHLSPAMTLLSNGDEIAMRYGVKGTPALYLVSIEGKVIYSRPNGAQPEDVRDSLLRLLARETN